ncbi:MULTISPECIES: serine protease inhibitor ecotin [Burkholderia]|uniref:Ecotin n=1 Tax=Burkholderia savannae TaxID=1637837 RepID=A0ABR5TFL0_9BURK|nr:MULTISPECIES: serine protease inhibitor ecotin [Burkholderia]AOJ69596.1 ecotin [Burkholderia savannae]AOJ81566.1 ecotin [Burkholderia savannae]AOK47730.1 ecotin [Burkholderia sp. MSMB617WGS]KVG44415.1 ecotin [Burkholderia sp. MSMB0265]KVG82713.1 ecotin [Burkholderia sp. MSMB2040]
MKSASRLAAWAACAAFVGFSGVAAAASAATPAAGVDPASAPTPSAEDIKMFPAAQAGQKREVIVLPAEKLEDDIRVELVIGKKIKVDCNQHWFGGELKHETVKGWGYPYYVLADVKGPAGTLMACPGQEAQEAFVPVRGGGYLLRYNSRLPIVVYVPNEFEVRYRLWYGSNEVARAVEK